MWEQSQVAKLLEIIKKNRGMLKDKFHTKKNVWDKIAKELAEDFSAMECDQKWRNLKESYKNYELNKKKTGRGRMTVPAFYAELHDMLSDDHTVQPVALYDSHVPQLVQSPPVPVSQSAQQEAEIPETPSGPAPKKFCKVRLHDGKFVTAGSLWYYLNQAMYKLVFILVIGVFM